MNVYKNRQAQKKQTLAYKEAASRLLSEQTTMHLTLPYWPNVVEVEEGAYVEISLFIPKTELHPLKEKS